MRITSKTAELTASLPVPEGLSPAMIGKVVEVKIFHMREGQIHTERLEKHVGVLKQYSLSSSHIRFTLKGVEEFSFLYSKTSLEFSMPPLILKREHHGDNS